jgi:hypothetical protein
MIRSLVIIAVTGIVMSVVCLAAAIAIGGPDLFARGLWRWDWDAGRHMGVWRMPAASGPQSQRDFPWKGDRLEVNAPAEIEYVQAPGPAKLTIRAASADLDRVRVEGGRITLVNGAGDWRGLHVMLSAPNVTRFDLHGADRLRITGYNQDQLSLAVTGRADVTAAGQAKTVNVSFSGAGQADLSELKTAGASIDISGAGEATVGPTEWARVQISGMGDVNLLTRPARLETHVSGAGRIRQPGDNDDTAAGNSDDDDDDSGDDDSGPLRPA